METHEVVIWILVWIAIYVVGCAIIRPSLLQMLMVDPVRIYPTQPNDDDVALKNIIDLLEEAKEEIEIYDDGNQIEGSPYDDGALIEAVENKLGDNKNFKIVCFFNSSDRLTFKERFQNNKQVDIHIRENESPPRYDTHYKIIDCGRKACLSEHDPDDSAKRSYRIFDCTKVREKDVEKAGKLLFGAYRQKLGKEWQPLKPSMGQGL